jgi:hypothetical protein
MTTAPPRRIALAVLLVALLSASIAALPAGAQPAATFAAAVDRTTVTVGDRIHVTLTLTLPAGAQVDRTAIEQQFGPLEIIYAALPEERPLPDGRTELRLGYDAALFRVGPAELPSITATFRIPTGESGSVASAPVPITVESVIPAGDAAAEIRDLKPQAEIARASAVNWRLLALAALVIAAVVVLAVVISRRRRRPLAVPPPVESEPGSPEDTARAALDRVAALGLLDHGEVKEFHALLAQIIRRYLTERHGFPGYAMTTTELRRSMEGYGVDRWQARLVAGLLTESDAVNYAQYVPARVRCEANLEMAYQIVELGRPPLPEPVVEDAREPAEVGG